MFHFCFFFLFIFFFFFFFFFQAEDGIRDRDVTGVQTCALPISTRGCRLAAVLCPGRDGRPGLSGVPARRAHRRRDPLLTEPPAVVGGLFLERQPPLRREQSRRRRRSGGMDATDSARHRRARRRARQRCRRSPRRTAARGTVARDRRVPLHRARSRLPAAGPARIQARFPDAAFLEVG